MTERPHLGQLNLQAQGPAPRVLFVCSGGMLRSATCAHWGAAVKGWNTRSAGTMAAALPPIHENLMEWALTVFAMEESHADHLRALYPWAAHKIEVLGIPDVFAYRAPELIQILEERFP